MTNYDGLEWIARTHDAGFGLLAVRDVTLELVLARLGVPVDEQVRLTPRQTSQPDDPPRIWGVRAGIAANGWTFAVGPGGACASGYYARVASTGTEAVAVSYIDAKGMVWFRHARDTRVLSSFEPGMSDALAGGPRLEITDEMRAVLTSGETDRMRLAFALLHDAFGVRISKEDVDQPLPGGFIDWK